MAWVKRRGDGARFEVFGTRRSDHGSTEILIYLTVPTAYYAKGWIWVPINEFVPVHVRLWSEPDQESGGYA